MGTQYYTNKNITTLLIDQLERNDDFVICDGDMIKNKAQEDHV